MQTCLICWGLVGEAEQGRSGVFGEGQEEVTEYEAKQRWCPFARVVVAQGRSLTAKKPLASGNRVSGPLAPDGASREDMTNPEASRCIASACMAWRWDIERNRAGPEIDHGYCGLAGKPE